jgi:glycosyltransferase involved in cell wall biosynthesis
MGARRPIRIMFDAQCMVGNKTGIGNYADRLVSSLAASFPDDVSLTGFYAAPRRVADLPTASNISYRRLPVSRKILNELRRRHLLPPIEVLARKRADFLLFPDFLDIPSLFKTPRAVAVHDLTYYDHPEYVATKNARDLTRFIPKSLSRSTFLLTVSQFSANRIHEIYGTPLSDIVVTPVPPKVTPPLPQATASELIKKQGLDKPFILFVSTLEPRKNLGALMDAYTKLPAATRDAFSLVIVGKVDWKAEATVTQLTSLQEQGFDIRTTGFVDDDTRTALYQSATAFVMPSHYEGFGMPILEALQFGLPCLVSDIPPFHEVGGDLVQYFSPEDSTELAQKLETLLSNLPKKQPRANNQPSWEAISKAVFDRISETLGSA